METGLFADLHELQRKRRNNVSEYRKKAGAARLAFGAAGVTARGRAIQSGCTHAIRCRAGAGL